jgi:uncharacterized protein YfdQ (DUF2303 family)
VSAGDSDVQAAVEAGMAVAEPKVIEDDSRYVVVVPENGQVQLIDPRPDGERLNPRRARGTATVFDVDSFAALWTKHSDVSSEVFADPFGFTVTGIFNADAGAGLLAGHRDHRVVLECRLTKGWLAWAANDGKLLSQEEFAEFLEERAIDVRTPSGAELLEIAQTLEATTRSEFKSAVTLQSGVKSLTYDVEQSARAGLDGTLEIPGTFELAIAPFDGGDRFAMTARFRYRLRDGKLALGYRLERPEDVLRAAFDDVREKVSQAADRQVVVGTAPPPR